MPLDPLTLISAIVAIVVVWKLRSVLGQRTGLEKPPSSPFTERPRNQVAPASAPLAKSGTDNVVRLPGAAMPLSSDTGRWRPHAEPGSPVASGLDAIALADPAFSVGPFLDGAKIAYETIVTAFASGDRKTLQSLLVKDVFDGFAAALDERAKRGDVLTTTFVSIDDAKIEAASQEARSARITVRFQSKQITATHAKDGRLIDGSADQVVDMDDIWTFARDVSSRDPNWKLVATQSGH